MGVQLQVGGRELERLRLMNTARWVVRRWVDNVFSPPAAADAAGLLGRLASSTNQPAGLRPIDRFVLHLTNRLAAPRW